MARNTSGLVPFKKGDPWASEAGKRSKRGPSLLTALKKTLATDKKLTPDRISQGMLLSMMKGNAGMARLVMEYLEGKVPDKFKVDHEFILKPPPKPAASAQKKMIRKKKTLKK